MTAAGTTPEGGGARAKLTTFYSQPRKTTQVNKLNPQFSIHQCKQATLEALAKLGAASVSRFPDSEGGAFMTVTIVIDGVTVTLFAPMDAE